uniref:Uncharacterized protein n=1 Tax=Anguilla anguilla TaxID=7936 RepID=A0A0E9XML6_ANGAN
MHLLCTDCSSPTTHLHASFTVSPAESLPLAHCPHPGRGCKPGSAGSGGRWR